MREREREKRGGEVRGGEEKEGKGREGKDGKTIEEGSRIFKTRVEGWRT